MGNYLYNLCVDKEIELIYTNNQVRLLTSYLNDDDDRIIVANNIFRDCPENVAKAVIDYYINEKNKDNNLNIIKNFIEGIFTLEKYMIDDIVISSEEKQKEIEKDIDDIAEPKIEKNNKEAQEKVSLIEMEIQAITQKSFKEGSRESTNNILSKLSPDDVLELDIIVKPQYTK